MWDLDEGAAWEQAQAQRTTVVAREWGEDLRGVEAHQTRAPGSQAVDLLVSRSTGAQSFDDDVAFESQGGAGGAGEGEHPSSVEVWARQGPVGFA